MFAFTDNQNTSLKKCSDEPTKKEMCIFPVTRLTHIVFHFADYWIGKHTLFILMFIEHTLNLCITCLLNFYWHTSNMAMKYITFVSFQLPIVQPFMYHSHVNYHKSTFSIFLYVHKNMVWTIFCKVFPRTLHF